MSAAAAGAPAMGAPAADAAPGGLRAAVYASPLYALTLRGAAPRGLALHPPDPWRGDAAAGDRLFQGRYRFAGHEVTSAASPVWAPPGVAAAWLEAMHGFAWLRHFKASGGAAARRHARALVADWICRCGQWRPGIWDAAVTGRRIAAWTAAAGFLLNGADTGWRSAFLASLGVQARHLARSAHGETAGARRIAALCGLLHARLCLGHGARHADRALRRLVRECERQVLPDGGHVDRSPAGQCAVLADLVDCRELLRAAGRTPPPPLCDAIDRMAPVLAALCHGDGGLAAFNGSPERAFPDPAAVLKAAAPAARRPAKPLANARCLGFQRLAAGRSVLIVDAGAAAAESSAGAVGHAGAGAFEMSVGAHRLIVNCGPRGAHGDDWGAALRRSAAHSTLVVADASLDAAAPVACERHADSGALWLEVTRHGYARRFGFVHRRRLYVAADGNDVRGEDVLSPAPGAPPEAPRPFAVRFHLHPTVTAVPARDGEAVSLRPADGAEWRLHASGGGLAVNPSVYFADDYTPRRTVQAVVAGVCGTEGATVRWALRRERG